MIYIVTIVGARPQIIKAAAISRAIKKSFSDKITEIIVHTGQHYDNNMSDVFFKQLDIPAPTYNLSVGSDSHGRQTAGMMIKLEELLQQIKPDCVLVYGDTNSTVASALVASKMHIPLVHIEAGMRSFNKNMPEEINRIMCDHCSTLLFSPTLTGINNLMNEGFKPDNKSPFSINNPAIYHCGDIMYDNSLYFANKAIAYSKILEKYELEENKYLLCTIHRDINTDNPEKLTAIFKALNHISAENKIKIILPLHPRTSKLLGSNLDKNTYNNLKNNKLFIITEPASFLDMIMLEKNAKMIFTDSGGVQKESYFFNKPCIILRSETEWVEILEHKAGILVNTNENIIKNAFEHFKNNPVKHFPEVFGNGKAAEFICSEILKEITIAN